MWVIMSKQIYYKDKDFRIWYELEDGELFAHISIDNASKSGMDNALKVWAQFKTQAYFEGFERIMTSTRDERIFKWFPFATKKGEIGPDNYKLGVWQWELK